MFFTSKRLLLYWCTTWTLTKRMEKKLDGNYTRMLWVILNKSWRQHPTKQQLYDHLPLITKTIKVGRTRHAGHSWRSGDEVINDILLWTPSHGRAKARRPAKTYIQLCADTVCNLEDLLGAIDNRDGWWDRVRSIRAGNATWWWYKINKSEKTNKVSYASFFLLLFSTRFELWLFIRAEVLMKKNP